MKRQQGIAFMPTEQKQRRGSLLHAAWEVARAYRAHAAYGSENKAYKALRRRCPAFTARQCENAFRKAIAFYDASVEAVARDAAALWQETDAAANRFPDFRDLVNEMRLRFPGFRVSTYRSALSWVFLWYHLM